MIGVLDSGLGGLSVLREVEALGLGHDVLYVADHAAGPYGDKGLDEVRDRTTAVATWLLGQGAETVVLACNTASAAALKSLRKLHPHIPFVGMEPAVKPAALSSESGVIGVIATAATFQGELFATAVANHGAETEVLTQACPGLADLVDLGRTNGPEALALLERFLTPLLDGGADTIVLGCTHYPFLIDAIRAVVGDDVDIVDPSRAVARQVQRVTPSRRDTASVDLVTTGDAERASKAASLLLGSSRAFRWESIE